MTNEPDDNDELQISDLRPLEPRRPQAASSRLRWLLRVRAWRWAPLIVSLLLLAALAFSFLPQSADLLRALATAGRASTLTPLAGSGPMHTLEHTVNPGPATVLLTPPAPALGWAPARCDTTAPRLTHVGPPQWGVAVGKAPVWLAGMSGAYPTLRLGEEARAYDYSWSAPYTQFGWPAPIGLVLGSGFDFSQSVVLSGWNVTTGEAVSFGFITAGIWGAPDYVAPAYVLDTASGTPPAGGADSTGTFWYGYAFIPRAGYYVLTASWPDGNWKATVSAGR
jgi:hypothetical protein